MIFVANQIILMVETIVCFNLKKNGKKFFAIISFLQLFVLLGCRGLTVGIDTSTYISLFRVLCAGGNVIQLEILNRIMMLGVSRLPIENQETVLLCLYAAITLIAFYIFIYSESYDVYLSVCIFTGMMYYYFSFNAMRQALAMAIVSIAISKLNKEKSLSFLVLVIIASGFHTSALVALPLWIVKKISLKYSWKLYMIFVVASASMVVIGREVVELLLVFFPSYRGYINSVFAEEGNYLNPLMYLAVLTIVTIIWNSTKKNSEDNLYLVMLGVGTVIYFMSIQVGIVNRIVYYYTMSIIVILPNLFKRIPKIKNRVPLSVGAHLMVLIYSGLLVMREAHGIVPYSFFWQM